VLGEDRKRMLGEVEEAVVEGQRDGSRERLARLEEVDRGQDVGPCLDAQSRAHAPRLLLGRHRRIAGFPIPGEDEAEYNDH